MKVRLTALERRSKALAEAVRSAGVAEGDFVVIDPAEFLRLSQVHGPVKSALRRGWSFGLGDLVYWLAWPLAKTLKLDCRNCDGRRRRWNRLLRLCSGPWHP